MTIEIRAYETTGRIVHSSDFIEVGDTPHMPITTKNIALAVEKAIKQVRAAKKRFGAKA